VEVGDVVSPETLREFCDGSVAMMEWLQAQGIPFDSSLCPDKTSYPTNRHYLYYSGSELAFKHEASPAPRGHRAHGKGTSGRVLFARLADAVRRNGIRVVTQTTAQRLITDDAGRVIGVQCRTLRKTRLHGCSVAWPPSRSSTYQSSAASCIGESFGSNASTPRRSTSRPAKGSCCVRAGSSTTAR
jgi:3-oxo-5alpha-steroid 4-dehydrogenase